MQANGISHYFRPGSAPAAAPALQRLRSGPSQEGGRAEPGTAPAGHARPSGVVGTEQHECSSPRQAALQLCGSPGSSADRPPRRQAPLKPLMGFQHQPKPAALHQPPPWQLQDRVRSGQLPASSPTEPPGNGTTAAASRPLATYATHKPMQRGMPPAKAALMSARQAEPADQAAAGGRQAAQPPHSRFAAFAFQPRQQHQDAGLAAEPERLGKRRPVGANAATAQRKRVSALPSGLPASVKVSAGCLQRSWLSSCVAYVKVAPAVCKPAGSALAWRLTGHMCCRLRLCSTARPQHCWHCRVSTLGAQPAPGPCRS